MFLPRRWQEFRAPGSSVEVPTNDQEDHLKRFTTLAALITALAAIAVPGAAMAATGGDNNAGDFWVDTVGAPQGTGHEMDPHLPCANVNVWGDQLADPSEAYTVIGIPPSGSQRQAY